MGDKKLKPCPFCGAGACLYIGGYGGYKIECDGCGIAAVDEDEEALIELWNTRDILGEVDVINDCQTLKIKEKVILLDKLIKKYNK